MTFKFHLLYCIVVQKRDKGGIFSIFNDSALVLVSMKNLRN